MIFGVCTPPFVRKILHLVSKTSLISAGPFLVYKFISISYEFWSLHAPLRKKILHLVNYQMLNFTFNFGALKMLNFRPFL